MTQDRVPELRARFQSETNPVHKAKMIPRLADAEFSDIQNQVAAGNLADAAAIAAQVRDEARTAQAALDGTKRDAEKHPEGYRQLQISVRESVRRLNDLLTGMAGDEQKPFQEARDDLEKMDRQLIHQLFPDRPKASATPANPKS
ncbi:MAG: hypothetical protein WCA00_08545 [Candidatus Acidiferrales bacterium]